MLKAIGAGIPPAAAKACEETLSRLSSREQRVTQDAATAWAALTSDRPRWSMAWDS
jgi:hypothetical protein